MSVNQNTPNPLGSIVKQYRKSKGLTQGELGKILGVSDSFVSQIENGKKYIPTPLLRMVMSTFTGEPILSLKSEPASKAEIIHKQDRLTHEKTKELMGPVKECRIYLGISRDEVAQALSIPVTSYVNYEYGVRGLPRDYVKPVYDFITASVGSMRHKCESDYPSKSVVSTSNVLDTMELNLAKVFESLGIKKSKEVKSKLTPKAPTTLPVVPLSKPEPKEQTIVVKPESIPETPTTPTVKEPSNLTELIKELQNIKSKLSRTCEELDALNWLIVESLVN